MRIETHIELQLEKQYKPRNQEVAVHVWVECALELCMESRVNISRTRLMLSASTVSETHMEGPYPSQSRVGRARALG